MIYIINACLVSFSPSFNFISTKLAPIYAGAHWVTVAPLVFFYTCLFGAALQGVRGSNLGLATLISETGYLLLPTPDITSSK